MQFISFMQISIPILHEGLSQIDVTQNMCAGAFLWFPPQIFLDNTLDEKKTTIMHCNVFLITSIYDIFVISTIVTAFF